MNQIRETLNTIFKLSEEEINIFLSAFTRTTLYKGAVFIEPGKVCNKIGLIEKGFMACVYNKDGTEVIDEFAFENYFITDYYSFLTHTPSEKEIRCIEETVLYVISREQLEQLASSHLFVQQMNSIMNEKLFLRAHNRVKSLLLDSAQERYNQLITERPDLVQRIPQYLLAAYLNVSPETISRIRKNTGIIN